MRRVRRGLEANKEVTPGRLGFCCCSLFHRQDGSSQTKISNGPREIYNVVAVAKEKTYATLKCSKTEQKQQQDSEKRC